jgi:dienelactone hydrolase
LLLGSNVWSFDFLNDRLKDVSFLLDRIAKWNAEDPFFRGHFDLDRLGIMGWSWGRGTAAEACRIEDRLKAAVLLDAYFGSVPDLLKSGLNKPFLTMMNPGGSGDNTRLFNKSAKDAYQLSIKDAAHEAFTDNAWTVGPTTASRRRAQAMNACLLSFFNKHLKGMDDHLLDNPGAVHPDVIAFRKK